MQIKDSYANVLELVDDTYTNNQAEFEDIVKNYKDVEIQVKDKKIFLLSGSDIYIIDYKTNFATTKKKKDGKTVYTESRIGQLINTYISDDKDITTEFVGSKTTTTADGKEIKYSDAIQAIATKYTNSIYEKQLSETSFLWVGNIWVADSPFKQSVLSFDDYKGMVGSDNVATNEKAIYNSFMKSVEKNYNKTNGYFILAVISIGITYLSMMLTNGIKKKKSDQPQVKQNKIMMFIMPIIMGIFAIMYNSVFAFYLVVSQGINVLLTPLENFLVDKWEARDQKKEDEKNAVEYSRKKI